MIVTHICEISVPTFVHGCVRGTPIDSFKNYYDFRGDTHNYNLRNNEDLTSNQVRSNHNPLSGSKVMEKHS